MKTSNKILLTVAVILFLIIAGNAIFFRLYFSRVVLMPGPVIITELSQNAEDVQPSKGIVTIKNKTSSAANETEMQLKPFSSVAIRGAWDVKITQGKQYSVKIIATPEIESRIQILNDNNQLYLSVSDLHDDWNIHPTLIIAKITTPTLNEIRIAGASSVVFDGFKADNFNLDSSGASQVYGKNSEIKKLTLKGTGASYIDLLNVNAHDVDFRVAGTSKIKLNMTGGNLTGTAAGVSEIQYTGKVGNKDITTFGVSSVKPVH